VNSLRWSIYKVKGGWTWKVIFRRRLYMGTGFTTKNEAWDDLHWALEMLHESNGERSI